MYPHLVTTAQRNPTRVLLFCMTMLLSACSTVSQKPTEPQDWLQHQAQLNDIHSWTIRGKLGIRSTDANHSATVFWRQNGDEYHIQLNGPLGQGKVRLKGNARQLTLERQGQPPQVTDDAETLLIDQLGWALPIDQIPYWIKGMPQPHTPSSGQQLHDGLLTDLHQSGWQLHYSHYQASNNTVLPGKLVLERSPVKLTLIIKQWQIRAKTPAQQN